MKTWCALSLLLGLMALTGCDSNTSYGPDNGAIVRLNADENIAWSVGVGSPIPESLPGSIARTLDAGATWVNQELPVPTGL